MGTAWAINAGLLGILKFGHSALSEDGFSGGLPYKERNTFFKLFTGLDHGGLNDAGGELPDARFHHWQLYSGYSKLEHSLVPEASEINCPCFLHYPTSLELIPDAVGFDQNGDRIGYVFDPGTYLPSGQSQVFWAGTDGRQPHYTLFSANQDAQCIAFVTASWPNLDRHFGWVGDWGQECAGDDETIATWYFSKIAIPGTTHFPNCLWIDQDGGQPATAFQVNWPDMKPLGDDNRVGKKAYGMCHSPSFHIYQHWDPAHIVIHKRDDAEAAEANHSKPTPLLKRAKPRRSVAEAKLAFERKYGNMLVIDDLPSHTARSLCESGTSAGPSFVNPEHGYYCDMKTKAIHPVCSGAHSLHQNSTFCFDMDQNELVGPGIQKRSIPFEVQDWRNSKTY